MLEKVPKAQELIETLLYTIRQIGFVSYLHIIGLQLVYIKYITAIMDTTNISELILHENARKYFVLTCQAAGHVTPLAHRVNVKRFDGRPDDGGEKEDNNIICGNQRRTKETIIYKTEAYI